MRCLVIPWTFAANLCEPFTGGCATSDAAARSELRTFQIDIGLATYLVTFSRLKVQADLEDMDDLLFPDSHLIVD